MRRGIVMGVGLVAMLVIPAVPAGARVDQSEVAVVDPVGRWHVRFADGSTTEFFYGIPGDVPLAGDWDCDGTDTPAMYRPSTGFVYLRQSLTTGLADREFHYGLPGDVPLAGDWNGDGCDTLSIYRPSEGRVYVSNTLGTRPADMTFYFGNPGDRPFAGDFDGNGIDTVGLYRVTTGFVYFRNTLTTGVADLSFYYGVPSDTILAGDWDRDGDDTVGIYRPSEGRFYLSFENAQRVADATRYFGEPGWTPVTGNFSGYRPAVAGGIRINVGGPALPGSPDWLTDVPEPSPFLGGFHAVGDRVSRPISPAGDAPAALFSSYRFGPMEWSLPVVPGRYRVDLFFAETFAASQAVGARVFDVSIEGVTVLDDFDIFAVAGADTGVVRSFDVVADQVLDIDFFNIVGNPSLAGLAVTRVPQPGMVGSTPGAVVFGSSAVGETSTRAVQLVNLGSRGQGVVTVTGVTVDGPGFTVKGPQVMDVAPGGTVPYSVTFAPTTAGPVAAVLRVDYLSGGVPFRTDIPLIGEGSTVIVYRINAGGPPIDGTVPWIADTGLVVSGGGTFIAQVPVGLGDVSLPSGTAPEVFQTERWGPQTWRLPLANGVYEVRLYFAETFHDAAGERVFDITIEGVPALAGFDILSQAGGRNLGIMRPVLVTVTDGAVDMVLGPRVDQPSLRGVEVVRITGSATLAADPSTVAFGEVPLGGSGSRAVVVRNAGAAGSPSLRLSVPAGGAVQGVDAAAFTVTGLVDGAILPPGASTVLTVSFIAGPAGPRRASLVVGYDGPGSPLEVPVTAVAGATPVVSDVVAAGPEASASILWVPRVADQDPGDVVTCAVVAGSGVPAGAEARATVTPGCGTGTFLPSSPAVLAPGTYTFRYRGTDTLGRSAEGTVTILVDNLSPSAADVTVSAVEGGGPVGWTPLVGDPGPGPLTCSIVSGSGSPPGVEARAGVPPSCAGGTFDPTGLAAGKYTFEYRVADPGGLSDTGTVGVVVNRAG